METPTTTPSQLARWRLGLQVTGVILVLIAGVLQLGLDGFEDRSGYAGLGPRSMPILIMVILGLLAAGHFWSAWRGRPRQDEELPDERSADWAGGAWLGLGALLSVLLIEPGGFVVSTTVLFVCTTRALLSYDTLKNTLIGLGLSLFVYVAFTRGLNVQLPAGVLKWIGL